MKKLFLYIFLVLMFSFSVFADEYKLNCISDKEFVVVFSVNEDNKEIVHLLSKSLDSEQEWGSDPD